MSSTRQQYAAAPGAPPEPTAWDWRAVLRICRQEADRALPPGADREDAAQEAAIRVWRRRATCRSADTADAWTRQIARNEAMRAAARGSRRSGRETASSELPEAPAYPALDALELELTLRAQLALLPAADRQLLGLRYGDDLTQPQIAAELGVPEGTVKVRLHRARDRLRRELLRQAAIRTPGTPGRA
jgi:RNA polymerase sigma-70 factor (ECF subfamily)